MKSLFLRYDAFENQLIERFREHPFLRQVKTLTDEEFTQWLLQLGHLSANFIRWEDRAKLPLDSESAKEVVREILRDEIPRNKPTHQDNRFYDLRRIGVDPIRILNTPPTAETKATIQCFYDLVRFPQDHLDLRVLVVLRVLGEITVAAVYLHVKLELERRFGFKSEDQRFFAPHFYHDVKGGHSDEYNDADGEDDAGHAAKFNEAIEGLITDEETLAIAIETAEAAANVRYSFHDQFLTKAVAWRRARQVAAIAAVLAILGVVTWGAFQVPPTIKSARLQAKREWYQQFLRESSPRDREFHMKMDQMLAERALRNGNIDDLAKVGTYESGYEIYGYGP